MFKVEEQISVKLHGVISQRTVILIVITVRTWNLNVLRYVCQSTCG